MRRPALAVLALEDRAVPAIVGLTTGFAVGEDTFTNRASITGNTALAAPVASLYTPNLAVEQTIPLGSEFTGGVRVARADFNNDRTDDLLVGSGPGVAARVRVYDGKTRALISTLQPFEESFTGGVFVAAGDLTGDGRPDVIVTPDQGGGPRVRGFNGASFQPFLDFLGIADPNFRGGARAAVGDVTGDNFPDLVVAAGFGGGPRIAGWDGSLRAGDALTRSAFPDFFAYEQTLRNGAFVTVGDVDNDRVADVITGAGPGGGPRVKAFDGRQLLVNVQATFADFFAGDTTARGGVRVAAKDLDGDFQADLVTGSAPTAGRTVTTYAGKNLGLASPPAVLRTFEAFTTGSFADGVFVG